MNTQLTVLNESKALRQKVCSRDAKILLDKCGNLEYLAELESVTKDAICRYYGISVVALNKLLQRHREELIDFGYNVLSKKDLKNETRCLISKNLTIPNRGLAIFPPPAILCVGLLLRDSEVAKKLRSIIWNHLLTRKEEFFNEEVLLESRSFRDGFCTDEYLRILDKVGMLATLPNTAWSTVEQVAEFYQEKRKTIEKICERHKAELKQDGYIILKKKDLANRQLVGFIDTTTSRLAIFPRRAILRVGMLLRDSLVAKEVRSYLLHAESQTPWRREREETTSVSLPIPLPYVTKEDLQSVLEALEERRKEDLLEIHQRFNALEEQKKEEKESLKEDLLFLLTSLREMDTRLKGGLNFLLEAISEQEERWKREFWKRITQGDCHWESQLEDIHHKIHLLSQEIELMKARLCALENKPEKDNPKFQEWKRQLSGSMAQVSRSIDQLFQVLSEWEE